MTDDELLKLAGKAGGLKWGGDTFYDKFGPLIEWNPLQYIGDAIGLAIDLRLSMHINDRAAWVHQDDESMVGDTAASSMVMFSETGYNKYRALRRAITLAAAEIGRRTE